MSARTMILASVAFVFTSMPFSLFSQAAPEATEPGGMDQWLTEMRYIQSQLAPIEERALREPDLASRQNQVGTALLAAMTAADSTVAGKLERLRQILVEVAMTDDQATLDSLGAEAHALQPDIDRARNRALENPEIAAQVGAFRNALCERMAEIAPESADLIDRYEELQRLINASLRQSSSPPSLIGLR